jgi:hypothetical protein
MRSMDWIYRAQDRDRWQSCESDNEPSGSINCGDFFKLTGDLFSLSRRSFAHGIR